MRARLGLALAALLACVGCGILPESGPVHRGSVGGADTEDSARFSAPTPGRGDSPAAIVNGFLQAMTADPSTTSVARSFLSTAAKSAWTPTRATVVYTSSSVTEQPGGFEVKAQLSDPRRLDSRGGWLGAEAPADGTLSMRMVREDGQWRIDDPPDALLVPDWFLEQRYQPYDLYFLDPSERTLVPDRVYVPRGEQTPSQLVRALLSGPGAGLDGVVRSAIPASYQLNLSVDVSVAGVADIPLSGPPGDTLTQGSPSRLLRAAAQLAWTLRQVPGVQRLRLSVNDAPVTLPDGRRDFSVQSGSAYSPADAGATTGLYGLRDGRAVVRTGSVERPVTGSFGATGYALRSLGVRLDGGAIAGVTADGHTLLVDREPKVAGARTPARRVYRGGNLLQPGYDANGTLWWVDAARGPATVLHMVNGRPTPVRVPGVTGRSVRSFLVSRSGTALAFVVAGARRDRVVSVPVQRGPDGSVLGVGRPVRLTGVPADLRDLRDLVWRSPNDLSVLGRLSNGVYETVGLSLDGSPGDFRAVPPDTRRDDVVGLVGSQDTRATTYLVLGGGQLLSLDDTGRWRSSGITKGLTAPTYAG